MMSISLCTYVGIYLALLISLPIPFLYDANNSTDHGPGRRSRWSTFTTVHVRFQCNGRLCRRRASQATSRSQATRVHQSVACPDAQHW